MIPLPDRTTFKLVIGIAAALMLAMLIHDRNRWRSRSESYAAQLGAERNAHSATVANYRAAAEQARREDAESLARVKAEQTQISERTSNDFEERIAAARASARRLRDQAAAAADSGARRVAPVPGLPAATGVIAQAAGEGGLSQSDRLIATEQAIQLDELIKWVRAQQAVPVK